VLMTNSSPLSSLPPDQLSVLLAAAQREQKKRKAQNRLKLYRPYTKQAEFHAAGAVHNERLFMAGNQLGKTVAGANEWAMHLTGLYPDWWIGRRFEEPGLYWAAGETSLSTRDTVQKMLMGPPEREDEWGTGTIPFDCILDTNKARTVADALDNVTVKHVSGGKSTLQFKAYEQGRAKWQGPTVMGVWCDEEPDSDIYAEGLTRTNATNGIMIVTFTPLKGMSDVVNLFLQDSDIAALQKMAA
jgi:phage terminase large subunit-like protein